MKRVLYVTWEGAAQNYMKSLFLPMLAHARSDALQLDAVWFTQSPEQTWSATLEEAKRLGVNLFAYPAHNRVPIVSQIGMVLHGARILRGLVLKHKYDAVFVRTHMPSSMAWAMQAFWPKGCALFFDSDGFPPDERIDAGLWTSSDPRYLAFRAVEQHTARRANATMVRTHKAKKIILERTGSRVHPSRIHVIPNAKDSDAFEPMTPAIRHETRANEGIAEDAQWLVYVGSLGPQYYPAQIVKLFELAWESNPKARLHVLTGQPDVMLALLDATQHPAHAHVVIKRVPTQDVPAYLAAADVGLSLRRPSFSQQGVCPIKNAEYLLCGTPVITVRGIGDMDALFDAHDVGLVLQDVETPELARAVEWLLTLNARRDVYRTQCREAGLEHFALDVQVQKLHDMLLNS